MQRSRLHCKLLHLFTKLGNREASPWGFSQDIQGIFKATISSLNIYLWLEHYGGAVFKGKKFWLCEEQESRTNYHIKQSNFVTVFAFFLVLSQMGTRNIT